MFIHNVVFYYYRAKLCVRQILPVTHPRFSPPMQHVRDVREVMSLPENSSVSFSWAPKWALSKRCIQFAANVHWLLLQFVSDIQDRCLCYERIMTLLQKRPYTPVPIKYIEIHPTKLFPEI